MSRCSITFIDRRTLSGLNFDIIMGPLQCLVTIWQGRALTMVSIRFGFIKLLSRRLGPLNSVLRVGIMRMRPSNRSKPAMFRLSVRSIARVASGVAALKLTVKNMIL